MRRNRKGSEIVEFALVLVPFLIMTIFLVDATVAIFTKSSIQRAVRVAVDQGVSLSAEQLATGACLTDTVKAAVQQNSLGILKGASKLALIKVNYFEPPAFSGGAVTDVSTLTTADTPGNIMQVSVQNFSLMPVMPLFFGPKQGFSYSPLNLSVYAAGLIQLTESSPCVGTAP